MSRLVRHWKIFAAALLLAAGCLHAAPEQALLSRTFDVTNQEGAVFTNARVLSLSSNNVLVTSPAGPARIFYTNLPPSIQAELAGMLAAERLNSPDQPSQSSRRRFYDRLISGLQGKTDEEKIQAFGPIVQFCVKEMKKLNHEMSESEKSGRSMIAAEEMKNKKAEEAASAERDGETARVDQGFAAGQLNASQRDEELLAIKTKYLATIEQGRKEFATAKARAWDTVLVVTKDQKAEYDALVDILKRVQKEQDAIAKRMGVQDAK